MLHAYKKKIALAYCLLLWLSMVQAHIYKEKYMHSWIILFSSYHIFKYYSYAYTNIRFLFLGWWWWTYSYDRKTDEVPNRKYFKPNIKLLLVLRFENVSIVAVLMDSYVKWGFFGLFLLFWKAFFGLFLLFGLAFLERSGSFVGFLEKFSTATLRPSSAPFQHLKFYFSVISFSLLRINY